MLPLNVTSQTVLSQMVEQFRAKHQRSPEKIVVVPLACLALAIKQSLSLTCQGISVECREVDVTEAVTEHGHARSLAIFLLPKGTTGHLVACDLKT